LEIAEGGLAGTAELICESAVGCLCGDCVFTCDSDVQSGSEVSTNYLIVFGVTNHQYSFLQELNKCSLLIPDEEKYECCDEKKSYWTM